MGTHRDSQMGTHRDSQTDVMRRVTDLGPLNLKKDIPNLFPQGSEKPMENEVEKI